MIRIAIPIAASLKTIELNLVPTHVPLDDWRKDLETSLQTPEHLKENKGLGEIPRAIAWELKV